MALLKKGGVGVYRTVLVALMDAVERKVYVYLILVKVLNLGGQVLGTVVFQGPEYKFWEACCSLSYLNNTTGKKKQK